MAFQHQAGTAMECLSVSLFSFSLPCSHSLRARLILGFCPQIPITLHKETGLDSEGKEVLKCGFRIGGGIDQDFRKSPQGYSDNVSAHSGYIHICMYSAGVLIFSIADLCNKILSYVHIVFINLFQNQSLSLANWYY